MRAAAIDIGTNSTRPARRGARPARRRPRDPRSPHDDHPARPGRRRDPRLAPEAIERTVDALRTYRDAIDAVGDVAAVRATATSAARDATNRDDFFTAATDVLGVTPELLSGSEEARLSFLGATTGLAAVAPAPYLVVDIGGGSTEFVVGTDAPEGLLSVDIGCVRLTETWLHGDPPTAEELSQAVHVVREHLADVLREVPGGRRRPRRSSGSPAPCRRFAMVEQGLAGVRPRQGPPLPPHQGRGRGRVPHARDRAGRRPAAQPGPRARAGRRHRRRRGHPRGGAAHVRIRRAARPARPTSSTG